MIYQFTTTEAKKRLQELVDAALRGETVRILKNDKDAVQLVPVQQPKGRRKFGSAKGLIDIADDFDAPLEDFIEYTS